jgi:cysteine-rich repeat protein
MRNSGIPRLRAARALAVSLALILVGGAVPKRADADVLAPFQTTPVFTGLTAPTAVRFAPDGRVFVIEQAGLIKVYNSINDPTPDVAADLSSEVFNNWDRGMLGLAIDPQFPAPGHDYIYVLYTVDAPPGQNPPVYNDACSDQTGNGCVTRGRLSRLEIGPNNVMIGTEQILVDNRWCFQYPSHSIGDLHFGPDGALYISSGEGASFTFIDYGQVGNPCGDPPNEGGALRAQDILTHGDPQSWDGALMRVDVSTGVVVPWPTNPTAGGPTTDDDAILAHGFRNPYRFTINPGPGALQGEVWVGDVGMDTWEEINRIPNPNGPLLNFGWPCFEGGSGVSTPMPGYQAANLPLCQGLYNGTIASNVTPSVFAYNHSANVIPGELCGINSGSITGVSFYEGTSYPPEYQGALFFEDYTRRCTWAMLPDAPGGVPDPANLRAIIWNAPSGAVDIEAGPNGDLFYSDYNAGNIMRLQYFQANLPPVARLTATPSSGPTPLNVAFDASGSADADGDALTYEWDLNGDGIYGDAPDSDPRFAHVTYTSPADVPVSVRVTDIHGASSTATVTVSVANSPPVPAILTPTSSVPWIVGQTINFSGVANDPDEGVLPASHLTWDLIIHHCFWLSPTNCHTHHVQTFAGVDHGSFVAPDHAYPSYLELDLTATDDGIGWYDKAWSIRRRITFNNAAQAEDLIGFPVLVQLTPTSIDYTKVQAAGQDVRFADNDGALLPYQIESWNPGGTSYVWVRVPQINASSSTDSILMYYGNPAAADAQNPTGVWDSSYAGVWHLGDTSDSTVNANNGANHGSTVVAGMFGNGTFFDGTDWIEVPNSISLELNGQDTLEAWVKLGPFINDWTRILDKKPIWNDTQGYDFEYTPRFGYAASLGSGDNFTEADNLNLDGNWHWLVATNTGNSAGHIYLDGVERTTDFSTSPLIPGTSVLDIGRSPALTAYFGGIIDELRIENVARSQAWISAEYLNMTGGFTSIGAEEGPGGLSVVTSVNIQAQTQNLSISTVPSGLQVSVTGITQTAPFVEPVITNSVSTIGVVSPQQLGQVSQVFHDWSDGGNQSHDVLANSDKSLTATFTGAGAVCGNGKVEPGEDCDDGNTLNGDCCSSTCHFEATGSSCTDHNACTVGETCNLGVCGGGTAVVCNDGNQCTQDSCVPATGCVFNPTPMNGQACNDGQVCTINDVCNAGTCAGSPAPDTDSDGVCNPADNCPYVPNSNQADDGGVDSAIPDGIGDVCQCGDLTGDGIVDNGDVAAYRSYLANPTGNPLIGAAAMKCNVFGANAAVCNILDVSVMRRAMLGFGPGVQQVCIAALPH